MMMRANIQAVSLKITGLKSTNAMAQAMKGVTKAMGQMNKQVKIVGLFFLFPRFLLGFFIDFIISHFLDHF
jgi:hypothetical protein